MFGNQDYFTGLGIFFDTYSNHNGEHAVRIIIITNKGSVMAGGGVSLPYIITSLVK